jgi:hypothetical protein
MLNIAKNELDPAGAVAGFLERTPRDRLIHSKQGDMHPLKVCQQSCDFLTANTR